MGKGQLLFKGDKAKKKKKKSKHSKKENEASEPEPEKVKPAPIEDASLALVGLGDASSAASKKPKTVAAAPSSSAPAIRKGTGEITASGTVVTGHDTIFEKEVANGDAIMVTVHGGQEELRVITMRLSNQSLNLSSAFSTGSLKTPTSFHYIRKPRDLHKERRDAQNLINETEHQRQQHAFDLYSNESLVYREKTETGSYRIKNETVSGGRSRGDLLQLRAKKTSDKYC